MNAKPTVKIAELRLVLLTLLLLLVACGPGAATTGALANEDAAEAEGAESAVQEESAVAAAPTASAAPVEDSEPVRIEANGEVPFYARFGENETFSDGELVTVVFYRPPECIPADFNLNAFFDFPGENTPGAFACAPPTTTSVETWANGPETDPAPLVAEMTGRGAVPVWFFTADDMEAAAADGVVTIGELASIPSRRIGSAATYKELLHPSQSNTQPLIQFSAVGTLEEGGNFTVDVSQGAPDVEDHITIDLGQ